MATLAGFLLPWRNWLAPAPSARPPQPAPADPVIPTDSTEPTDLTDPYGAPGTSPVEGASDEPALPEPVAAAPPRSPRLTVVSPEEGRAPEVKQRVLRAYPGNWSSPEALEERLAGSLDEERIYFRPGFGPAADHLAQELGYTAAPWPDGLAREHAEADLLVVYGGEP